MPSCSNTSTEQPLQAAAFSQEQHPARATPASTQMPEPPRATPTCTQMPEPPRETPTCTQSSQGQTSGSQDPINGQQQVMDTSILFGLIRNHISGCR